MKIEQRFSSPSRPSRPRSHQVSVTHWPPAVATSTTSSNSPGIANALMSLQVEGGARVQVPRALMQAFLQQDPNHPGLETVRIPRSTSDDLEDEANYDEAQPPTHCREVEEELCLVCRRCGRAYPRESTLLAHQRSCYLGNQQRRGALRLVHARFACSLCPSMETPSPTYATISDFRRHAETPRHRSRLEALQHRRAEPQEHQNQAITSGGDEGNPLTDEMEDVVNQITLLAARAAAESTTGSGMSQPAGTTIGSRDNNNGPESKRQKSMQEVAAIAGAR